MSKKITILSNINDVSVKVTENQIKVINDNLPNNIDVTQPVVNIIEVATSGPKGDKGDKGDAGDSIFFEVSESLYATSQSIEISGSLIVSGSGFTNIGNTTLTGFTELFGSGELNGYQILTSNDTGSLLLSSSFDNFVSDYIIDSSSFNLSIDSNTTNISNLSSSFTQFVDDYIIDSSSFDLGITNNTTNISNLSSSFDNFILTYNTGSFSGSFIGDGSQLTGIVSSKWSGSNPITRESDVEISGSLNVSGSTILQSVSGSTLTIIGDEPNATIFSVANSTATLFEITNTTTGSLFSVNDATGIPIFEVFDNKQIILGDSIAPALLTTTKNTFSSGNSTIVSLSNTDYSGAFFDYVVKSGTNLRSGNIMAVWDGSNIEYTEVSTNDLGNTSDVDFEVVINGSNINLNTIITSGVWDIKIIIKSI